MMRNRKSFITDLTQWINSNIESHMTILDVAVKSGYSRWHLQRIFLAETGQRLGNFIRETKLRCIAEELINSNAPLIQLSMKYGFDSQQSFTRAFHKKYNYPPMEYRKRFSLNTNKICHASKNNNNNNNMKGH